MLWSKGYTGMRAEMGKEQCRRSKQYGSILFSSTGLLGANCVSISKALLQKEYLQVVIRLLNVLGGK